MATPLVYSKTGIAGCASAPPPFHVRAEPIGALCNPDCEYCFSLPETQLYAGAPAWSNDEVLGSCLRQSDRSKQKATPQVCQECPVPVRRHSHCAALAGDSHGISIGKT